MRFRVINILLTIMITTAFLVLGATVFRTSYMRLSESVTDLGSSIAYFFCMVFRIESVNPTVTLPSKYLRVDGYIPENFDAFTESVKDYFGLLFNGENFMAWLGSLDVAVSVICGIIFVGIIASLVIKLLYAKGNTKHNKDTLPLRLFKRITAVTYVPLKTVVCDYAEFLKRHKWLLKLWLAIWLFNFNIVSVCVEAFAYLLYFVVALDFTTVYFQLYKLIVDLQVVVLKLPPWVVVIVVLLLLDRLRKKIAVARLRHFEARNCGFINELPIVSMSCGSMGKKKTTLITDMALSQEVMFRQKALEILQSADMKFPHFPWIAFEDELRACMDYGTVYNLATVKKWVALKRERFEQHHNPDLQLYGYDVSKYPLTFDDNLKVSNIFDVLETYAQAYFIYVIRCSLIVANYSVREDNELISEGNFPMWVTDFFPEGITEGRHAHILDFDALRLGRKVMENNPNAGSFEFGVVAITEIGKERGNNLELKEVKKGTDETNQKNDLFNSWLKMCRHSATVDNYPFIKVFTDEQRPESWGADARDLCDIIYIAQSEKQRLALPFYTLEETVSEWAFNKFIGLYYDFRYRRGDNTLLVHLLKSVTAWLWKRNLRIFNRYGYSVLRIEKQRGTMDGITEKRKYYLMNRKIYSRRFSTDCFSDYFNDMAGRTNVGLADYTEYLTEKASVEELKLQNSYFINALYKDAEKK